MLTLRRHGAGVREDETVSVETMTSFLLVFVSYIFFSRHDSFSLQHGYAFFLLLVFAGGLKRLADASPAVYNSSTTHTHEVFIVFAGLHKPCKYLRLA